MHVADVDELVGDDVVAVMGRPGSCHRVAVKVEDAGDDGEQRDELKSRESFNFDDLSKDQQKLTIPMTAVMIAPFWMFMY